MRGLGRSAEHSLHHCKELQLQRWIGVQWIGLPKSAISTADRTESPAQKVPHRKSGTESPARRVRHIKSCKNLAEESRTQIDINVRFAFANIEKILNAQ